MEAVTCAVSENDSKVLGDVDVLWTEKEDGVVQGVFNVAADLLEAHRIRFRPDDLLCVRCAQGRVQPYQLGIRPSLRAHLLDSLFNRLGNSSKYLDLLGLRPLADHTGFEGSASDWHQEYATLCAELACDPSRGLDLNAFTRLVNDTSEQGCYCDDSELQALLDNLGCDQTDVSGLSDCGLNVVHAVVESADKFGDNVQVRFHAPKGVIVEGPSWQTRGLVEVMPDVPISEDWRCFRTVGFAPCALVS